MNNGKGLNSKKLCLSLLISFSLTNGTFVFNCDDQESSWHRHFFFLTYCHYSKGLVFFCSRVSSVPTFLFASNVRGKKKGGKIVKPILHDEKFLEKKKKKNKKY